MPKQEGQNAEITARRTGKEGTGHELRSRRVRTGVNLMLNVDDDCRATCPTHGSQKKGKMSRGESEPRHKRESGEARQLQRMATAVRTMPARGGRQLGNFDARQGNANPQAQRIISRVPFPRSGPAPRTGQRSVRKWTPTTSWTRSPSSQPASRKWKANL